MNRLQNGRKIYRGPIRLAVMSAVALMSIQIGGCTMTDTVVTDVDCKVFQPVRWSKRDTLRTVEQIKQHNAVWRSICS